VYHPISLIRSAIPGSVWPAIPAADGAHALALQFQLELSQWYRPDQLRELQFRQLDVLLRHAHATVPYYRERWTGHYDPAVPLTPERFARLPVLPRGVVQEHFDAFKSTAPMPEHGTPTETRSSGATGMPVRVLKTSLTELIWQGTVLREHFWHRRHFDGKVAVIRYGVQAGMAPNWGAATIGVTATGSAALLPITTEVAAQMRWLQEQEPEYLLTYPSNAGELARLALARGTRFSRLREVMTLGEVVTEELRALCREAWNVPVVDAYSAQEVGYMALQCPEQEHYHVQSEAVMLEVVNHRGKPCDPGQIGLVVATPLHNFAMPLVRYVVGDYAEAGEPCSCGRGLPVLTRVMGRVRNMLALADGQRYWPVLGSSGFAKIAPVLQHQFVQKSYDLMEVRLVTARPLAEREESALRRHIQSRLPGSFDVRFTYLDRIPRSAGGKYEIFMSEVL
jgi:phenylacetate-CoA ligase